MGGEVTPKSDLYSLGAMLYEMVTGRPPFLGDDSVAILGQHINTPPVAPAWHNGQCPRPLEALIMRLLAKDPLERPESASDVFAALEAIDLADDAGAARPCAPALRGTLPGQPGRRRVRWAAAGDGGTEGLPGRRAFGAGTISHLGRRAGHRQDPHLPGVGHLRRAAGRPGFVGTQLRRARRAALLALGAGHPVLRSGTGSGAASPGDGFRGHRHSRGGIRGAGTPAGPATGAPVGAGSGPVPLVRLHLRLPKNANRWCWCWTTCIGPTSHR